MMVDIKLSDSTCKPGKVYHMKPAVTDEEKRIGLSGRKNILASDEGMLFYFQIPQAAHFWMKETWIPLTGLFFDETGKLLSAREMKVEGNPSEPKIFYTENSKTSVVLEIRPGQSRKHKPGKTVLCVDSN